MSREFVRAGIAFSIAFTGVVGVVSLSRGAESLATTRMTPPAIDSIVAKSLRWRSVGPDRGGRSIAISGVKGQPKVGYFGATGGGLWKTVDSGETWAPITDGLINSASVGAVAVSETDPNIIFIGMGESCIRGNIL